MATGLAADQRVIEFDFGLDAQAARIGPQFAGAVVLADPHRL